MKVSLVLMERIDKIWTSHPAFGSRKITSMLKRQGEEVNRKRVTRLMGVMGISSLLPKPSTTKVNKAHYKYPYLLKGVSVDHPNQVWCTDITYIPYKKGFFYLVAVIDWYSRKVLTWRLSNTMTNEFCISSLNEALTSYGKCEIFNSDQGVQFTSTEFTTILHDNEIAISMDGKGRAIDNVFIERFWRTLKYEHIYLNPTQSGTELKESIAKYITFYNQDRPHDGLGGSTPDEIYFDTSSNQQQVA